MLNYNPYKTDMKQALQLAYIDYCIQLARARAENYRIYREYYEGNHDTQLTDRMKAFLNIKSSESPDFSVNYVPMVVTAKSSRLNVTGFETGDDSKKTFQTWWQKNRMDALQGV